MEKVAIVGGSGVYDQHLLENARKIIVATRYGDVFLQGGLYRGREVFFLARHGPEHTLPPHRINYRANIAALKKIGVTAAVAIAAVGSLREDIAPGSRVLIDQFLDFTRGRDLTFFDGGADGVVHIDFSEPYCPSLRRFISRAADFLGQPLLIGGCYACTEGPRFETPAEIKMLSLLGADLVGMTNVPEVVLAREAGICYAAIALVTNYAAGISLHRLSHAEVLEAMENGKPELDRLLATVLEQIPGGRIRCCDHETAGWIAADCDYGVPDCTGSARNTGKIYKQEGPGKNEAAR